MNDKKEKRVLLSMGLMIVGLFFIALGVGMGLSHEKDNQNKQEHDIITGIIDSVSSNEESITMIQPDQEPIVVHIQEKTKIEKNVTLYQGEEISVSFNGVVLESYPPQIYADKITSTKKNS